MNRDEFAAHCERSGEILKRITEMGNLTRSLEHVFKDMLADENMGKTAAAATTAA